MSGLVRPAPWLQAARRARIGSMTIAADWRGIRLVAWSLAGLTLLRLVATLVLLGLDVRVISAGRILFYVLGTLALVLCTRESAA